MFLTVAIYKLFMLIPISCLTELKFNSNLTVATLMFTPILMCRDAEIIKREERIKCVEMHSTGGPGYSKKIHQKQRKKNGHPRPNQNPFFVAPALLLIQLGG